MNKYTQIKQEERCVIAHLWRLKKSINYIAKQLKRSWNSIEKEIKEKGKKDRFGKIIYGVIEAQNMYDNNRKNSKFKERKIENNLELENIIRNLIVDKQYSPEQIAGELALLNNHKNVISSVTIYKFIHESGDEDLKLNLRRKGKKYNYHKNRTNDKSIAPKKNISERPEIANARGRLGDGEGDTVILQGLERLYTLVDRKSRYLFAEYIPNGKAETIYHITCLLFRENEQFFKTITFDNGVEFSYHDLIYADTKIDIYFANPYHSYERGTNENTNGLLRQYFPKGATYDILNNDVVQCIVRKLNHRPRKCLNFLSPYQVFILKLDPLKDGLKLKVRSHRFRV